jgi:SP family arabinose:H+ symporter-like MFS transporter
MILAPETPRYLLKIGRDQEAFAILERISGRQSVEFEASEICASFLGKKNTWNELVQPGLRRATAVGFLLAHTGSCIRNQYDH